MFAKNEIETLRSVTMYTLLQERECFRMIVRGV
jgi:hypothetical protein